MTIVVTDELKRAVADYVSRQARVASLGEHLPVEEEGVFSPDVSEEVFEDSSPSGIVVTDDLKRAVADYVSRRGAPEPVPQELSLSEKIGQVARGVAGTYGGLLELGGMARPMMADLASNYEPYEVYGKKHLSEELPRAVDTIYGKDLTPTDSAGKFRQGIGEFIAPLPIPGAGGYISAAKSGAKALSRYAGKEAAVAGGASAATHLTPRISEEGTIPGAIEDITKGLAGATSGHVLTNLNPNHLASKIASKFVEPNVEMLSKAKKHDITVPFNVGANSKTANFIANNYLKSMYVSKQYKEALKEADASMLNAVKRSIDTLGESNLKPTEASLAYREHLKGEEKIFKKQADELYSKARESLGSQDKTVPKNTLKALNSEPMEELLSSLSPSSSEKSVINRINEIKSKLSGEHSISKSDLERYKDSPRFLEALRNNKAKEVSVKELINLRSSLMKTLDYEPEIRGSSAFLSRLAKTLDEDIKGISNKAFLEKYEAANKFFKQEIGQRFRKSISQSIMRNEAPREAYDLLNSVQNVKFLEKIAGENPKGKEIFESLKKSKVRDIIGNAIQGDLEDGSLRTAAFSKLFQKGEKRQEILEALLGKKEYNNLSEIAEIAEEFSKSGRDLLNTSGTAHVLSDMNLSKNVAKEVTQTLAYLTGSAGAGFSVAGLPGAAILLGTPYAISRLVSNPKFVNQMRAYAIARKQGRDRYSDTIIRKIIPMVVKEVNEQNRKEEDS